MRKVLYILLIIAAIIIIFALPTNAFGFWGNIDRPIDAPPPTQDKSITQESLDEEIDKMLKLDELENNNSEFDREQYKENMCNQVNTDELKQKSHTVPKKYKDQAKDLAKEYGFDESYSDEYIRQLHRYCDQN